MESIVDENNEVQILAISNTQTVGADKSKAAKESEATNAEKKVKLYIIYTFIYICCVHIFTYNF